jgi:endonuclease III
MENGFIIDSKRLDLVNEAVYNAFLAKEGVFAEDFKKFLPQWNLPKELEHSPIQKEPKNQFEASQFLWTSVFFERLNLSKVIIRNILNTWNQEDKRWFFNPIQVSNHSLEEITEIIQKDFQYNLKTKKEIRNEQKFKYNADKLVGEYGGDPTRLIQGKEVEQAKKELMQFKGIGTGIANLYLTYLHERGIASPINYEELSLKVDVHKARIPLNTDVVIVNSSEIRYDRLVKRLEEAYKISAKRLGLDTYNLDSALWIIGSKVCTSQDYNQCISKCPLCTNLCISNVGFNDKKSTYIITKDNLRVERRKNMRQKNLNF